MESESSPGLFLRFFCGKGSLRSKDVICENGDGNRVVWLILHEFLPKTLCILSIDKTAKSWI